MRGVLQHMYMLAGCDDGGQLQLHHQDGGGGLHLTYSQVTIIILMVIVITAMTVMSVMRVMT